MYVSRHTDTNDHPRPHGRFCKVAPLMLETLGYEENHLLKQDIFTLLFAEDKTTQVIEEVLAGSVLDVELRLRASRRVTDTPVWAQLKGYSVCNSRGGRVYACLCQRSQHDAIRLLCSPRYWRGVSSSAHARF
eukprot:EC119057.1.p1 GENE.EC119057.1~~EC119057.1.p1  ORF type:complete len:133 (+),score=4.77 EC119057.1:31-429(+)